MSKQTNTPIGTVEILNHSGPAAGSHLINRISLSGLSGSVIWIGIADIES